jgi:hypothetical protein
VQLNLVERKRYILLSFVSHRDSSNFQKILFRKEIRRKKNLKSDFKSTFYVQSNCEVVVALYELVVVAFVV